MEREVGTLRTLKNIEKRDRDISRRGQNREEGGIEEQGGKDI